MKVVQINVVCNGSTGKIMCDLARKLNEKGHESYIFFGRGNPKNDLNCKKIENKFSIYFHGLLGRLGLNGHGSYFSTKRLIKELKKINPDVIHLHNIHGYYLNLKVLFKYLKNKYKGKIVWTLHDCWTFTGHCAYFTMSKCNKWKTGCCKCQNLNCYPKESIDTTKKEYRLKKNLFTDLNNLTIITPSIWLKELVKKSFLKQYDVKVINNGIDLNIFKPQHDNKILEKYNIPKNKKIILGVANIWEERKGINDFIKLSKKIDSKKYQIVLVGTDENIEKILPKEIISIRRTDNQEELAKIYSSARVLFNPTYEDNYPTINLEAQACGLPVITYKTGGCPEQVPANNITDNNINNIIKKINQKLEIKDLKKEINEFIDKYLEVYEK